jgi:hypothetical protein
MKYYSIINFHGRKNNKEENKLCPSVWLVPVIKTVTGQFPVCLQDSSGKSVKGSEALLTARYWGAGTCNKGGHLSGLGTGQLGDWSKSENCKPQTVSHVPSPLVSIHWQPHLLLFLFSWLSTSVWVITRSIHSTNGKEISLQFALMFRFCKTNKQALRKNHCLLVLKGKERKEICYEQIKVDLYIY